MQLPLISINTPAQKADIFSQNQEPSILPLSPGQPSYLAPFVLLLKQMGKKMKLLPSLFKGKETRQPWQWPSCKHPKTLSFRAGKDMFKTVNSVFFDLANGVATPESWFTDTSESASLSTESEGELGGESVEVTIRGVQSERLFFEPGKTSSILEDKEKEKKKAKTKDDHQLHPFKESVVLAMESENPYGDFRKSMEEMVESHGLKDWDCLKDLLSWYLRANGKKNHGFILGAFVDLLFGLASCSDSTSFSSAVSSFSYPISVSSSHQLQHGDIHDDKEDDK